MILRPGIIKINPDGSYTLNDFDFENVPGKNIGKTPLEEALLFAREAIDQALEKNTYYEDKCNQG